MHMGRHIDDGLSEWWVPTQDRGVGMAMVFWYSDYFLMCIYPRVFSPLVARISSFFVQTIPQL